MPTPTTPNVSNTDNEFKLSYALRVVGLYLAVALLAGRVTLQAQLAMGIFFVYQLWGLTWINLLVTSTNIYSIRVPTARLEDWVPVSVPKGPLQIRKNRVVTSISELSGIRGANMMLALRVMTATINMLILVAIQADLHHRNAIFGYIQSQQDMVPVCLFVLAIGFFCTGHFELNNVDVLHTKGHFSGVSMIFFGTLAIGFHWKWNMASLLLLTLQFGVCTAWVTYEAKCPKKSDNVKEVTRISKICIGVELLLFYVTNTILVSTVYTLGGAAPTGNGWPSPWR
jgi:magnesium-transporting ATPase (P-type)